MGPAAASSGAQFSLEDRYQREEGAVYLTGIQDLVRTLLDRARADQRAGRATATYVTGYEGSPLGGFDFELARHAALLAEQKVYAYRFDGTRFDCGSKLGLVKATLHFALEDPSLAAATRDFVNQRR